MLMSSPVFISRQFGVLSETAFFPRSKDQIFPQRSDIAGCHFTNIPLHCVTQETVNYESNLVRFLHCVVNNRYPCSLKFTATQTFFSKVSFIFFSLFVSAIFCFWEKLFIDVNNDLSVLYISQEVVFSCLVFYSPFTIITHCYVQRSKTFATTRL